MFQNYVCVICVILQVVCFALSTPIAISEALLPTLEECGPVTEDRVIGGAKTDLNEFPWLALLIYETPEGKSILQDCHGALINKRYVLTAAHCIKLEVPFDKDKLKSVRLGEYDTALPEDCNFENSATVCAPPPLNVPVEKAVIHENYDSRNTNHYNDIGIIRLIANVPYSDYIKPICLPLAEFLQKETFIGRKTVLAGWGKTEKNDTSNIKLKVKLPVKANTRCSFEGRIILDETQICAGGIQNRDSCNGDSGAPLTIVSPDENQSNVNWYAIGIVSFGKMPCGMKDMPGVYTRVGSFVDWILKQIEP